MLDRTGASTPDASGGTPGADGNGQGNGGQTQTWDTYVEALAPETRALYDAHITGLRNTVQATRTERDTLKARVDALVGALDGKEPAAVKQQLTELQGELSTANQRAAFYEDAGRPEIGCRNPKLAFMVAQAESLFDRRGTPDWQAIKTAAPELFGTVTPQGNAGAGTGAPPPTPRTNINDYIRQVAGRR